MVERGGNTTPPFSGILATAETDRFPAVPAYPLAGLRLLQAEALEARHRSALVLRVEVRLT
jgi:hypothetical protein